MMSYRWILREVCPVGGNELGYHYVSNNFRILWLGLHNDTYLRDTGEHPVVLGVPEKLGE
jgi:hypothetical protein